MSRTAFSRLGGCLGGLTLFIAGYAFGQSTEPKVIQLAYPAPPNAHFRAGIDVFARDLSELTSGRFKVVPTAPKDTTTEAEILNKVKSGELEMGSTSTVYLGAIVPESKLFDLPFLFSDAAHARRTLDGPIGRGVLELFAKHGLIGLAWGENGFMHITNNKRPIGFPADFAGLKLRTAENSVHQETMRALKAAPATLAISKLYAGLKAGEIDGQENTLAVILAMKLTETQKYLSITQHFYSPSVFTVSPKLWATLSEQDRYAFKTAAKAAVKAQRERVNADEYEALNALRATGITINAFVEASAFRNTLKPAYDRILPGINPKIIEEIRQQK